MKNKEFEIKDFEGIAASNRNPSINQSQILKNLDLRSKYGDMVLRDGYVQKYIAPTHASLSSTGLLTFENFYVPDIGGGREVTLAVQKGTLSRVTGSGISPSTRPSLNFWIRPYWDIVAEGNITAHTTTAITTDITTSSTTQYVNGHLVMFKDREVFRQRILSHTSGANAIFTIEALPVSFETSTPAVCYLYFWTDAWQWLNETIYTKISTIPLTAGTPQQQYMELYLQDSNRDNYYMGWTIYNVTQKEYDTVRASTMALGVEVVTANVNNTWAANDVILLMRNYIPVEYIENMYNIATGDVCFHKILNDLRIGFGGYEKRIGLSIGYRQKYISVNNYPPTDTGAYGWGIPGYAEYAFINKIILDPVNCTGMQAESTATAVPGGSFPSGTYFYYITATLDGISEFIVDSGNVTTDPTNDIVNIALTLNKGVLNKRITGIRVYLSENDSGATVAAAPYYLCFEKTFNSTDDLSSSAPTPKLVFDDDGNIALYDTIAINYDAFLNNRGEFSEVTGYVSTTNYANSWDGAVVAQGRTFIVNPYIGERIPNKVFFSSITGDGTFQYDTIPAQNYHDLENFDGNNLIGIEFLPNLDYVACKTNATQIVDSQTGFVRNIEVGKGCISRRSIVNFGDKVAYCGDNSVYMTDGLQVVDIADKTVREDYRALTNKSGIIAVREEKDNAYRLFSGDTTNKTEYVLTKKGWITTVKNSYPEKYTIAADGTIWFLRNGVIYNENTDSFDNSNGISFQWKSVPIDINLLGSDITSRDRFAVTEMWVRYSGTIAFTLNIYLDGSATIYDSLTVLNARTFMRKPLKIFNSTLNRGLSCKYFELEITGVTTPPATGQKTNIAAIGILWKPIQTGLYGR